MSKEDPLFSFPLGAQAHQLLTAKMKIWQLLNKHATHMLNAYKPNNTTTMPEYIAWPTLNE